MEFINAIYGAEENGSRIRRVNVNLAPLSVEDFRRLKERNIGTFQLFQETYHRPTYGRVHLAGPKKDLDWRASTTWAWGCSTGLYDWRFETLALMAHIAHLEERFGVGCHTISVPHRTGHRVGFGLPAAVHLERSRFSQACRHIAPCRAVHGHYHVHSGKTGYPAADAGTRRFPDFGGQPYQSGWLSGIQPGSRRHNFSLAITAPSRK